LSYADLNDLNGVDRKQYGFDVEYADVINAVLPFDDCVAHVGEVGWGGGIYRGFQVRVYMTLLSPDEIDAKLRTSGLDTAKAEFERALLKPRTTESRWQKIAVEVFDSPSWSDAFWSGPIDFYMKPVGDRTAVFVVINRGGQQRQLSSILQSFRGPDDPQER